MDPDTQEIIECFVLESREALEEAELLMLGLEDGDACEGTLASVFRLFHSVKGSAGYLDFGSVGHVMHVAETLLGGIQAGSYPLSRGAVSTFFLTLDFLGERLDAIAVTFVDQGAEAQALALVARLEGLMGESHQGADSVEGAPEMASDAPETAGFQDFLNQIEKPFGNLSRVVDHWVDGQEAPLVDALAARLSELQAALVGGGCSDVEVYVGKLSGLAGRIRSGEIQASTLLAGTFERACGVLGESFALLPHERPVIENLSGQLGELSDVALDAREINERTRLGAMFVERGLLNSRQLEEVLSAPAPIGAAVVARGWIAQPELDALLDVQTKVRQGKPAQSGNRSGSKRAQRSSLRVDVRKLDLLMDLVGELIIAETAVTHDTVEGPRELEKAMAQLSRVTRSLQDVAMSLRMVAIADTFNKMKRLVRDVSTKQGKKVSLNITGEETEVDKTVAEIIADPLVHLMRNAVDHGMETPEERRAAGKPSKGVLNLEARHQAGEIWITVSDDGKGMDRSGILDKAVERGLVHRERGDTLSDSEVFAFVFEPGFSTSEVVTAISGRGVGMDVVKKNIERVKGRIEVTSILGQGTRFTLRIPLTMAIIEGMLVRVGSASFTIPLLSIRESFVTRTGAITRLTSGQELVRIRDELLPVIRLKELYKLPEGEEDIENGVLVVLESDRELVCLFVDELVGQRQTVVKGLSSYLGEVRGLSGCTVMGDGRISLILDVAGILGSLAA
ncbi:MAG: two-component system chemotaxis sensor kinase CheA [Cognaticolwellia sp.]|jgi:two-component system chemotaxis sensor kinase CheA